MAWVPFPFPECPYCQRKWAYSYHYQCPGYGQVEVDPDARIVRCEYCRSSWVVWHNKFLCACGNTFSSDDVSSAIEDIIATARLFAMIVERNQQQAARSRALGEASFRSWIGSVAEGIGGTLGGLLGALAGSLVRWLFGNS